MPRSRFTLGLSVLLLVVGSAFGQATRPATETPIRVAIYHDAGSTTAAAHVEKCLGAEPGRFTFKRVTAAEIREGVLKDFDVIVQGGGSGSGQAKALQDKGLANIKTFVQNGGGYLGICAGSYLASSSYPWSLHILNAKVLDREHWARGAGQVKLQLTPDARAQFAIGEPVVDCRYNQGPLLAPSDEKDLVAYTPLATFASEIAEKGAPKGVMIGTTAFATAPFGKGRVFCSSPHPEQTEGLDKIIRSAVTWSAGRETAAMESADKDVAKPTPAKPAAK